MAKVYSNSVRGVNQGDENMQSTAIKRLSLTFVVMVLFGTAILGQTSAKKSDPLTIVDKAEAEAKNYIETFRNLLADETKIFTIYKQNGKERTHRTVRSTFFVYPFTKEEGRVAEFRNVISVDGKEVDKGNTRAEKFFEKVAKAATSMEEFELLRTESLRYDPELDITGLTLFTAVSLDSSFRSYFQFSVGPRTEFNGRRVHEILYRQIRETPDIAVNSPKSTVSLNRAQDYEIDVDKPVPLNARMYGSLLIDAETFQTWHETRTISVQPAGFATPVPVITDVFEFQASDFGILTPKVITHTQFSINTKRATVTKEADIRFEYTNFTRPDVDVKSSEVKPN